MLDQDQNPFNANVMYFKILSNITNSVIISYDGDATFYFHLFSFQIHSFINVFRDLHHKMVDLK